MLISVLQHLVDPQFAIQFTWRLLRPAGLLLVNVPTWTGKRFLEFSAFRLGFSPKVEIDDHKCITTNATCGTCWFAAVSSQVRSDCGITISV
jgi:hypothetical protein